MVPTLRIYVSINVVVPAATFPTPQIATLHAKVFGASWETALLAHHGLEAPVQVHANHAFPPSAQGYQCNSFVWRSLQLNHFKGVNFTLGTITPCSSDGYFDLLERDYGYWQLVFPLDCLQSMLVWVLRAVPWMEYGFTKIMQETHSYVWKIITAMQLIK